MPIVQLESHLFNLLTTFQHSTFIPRHRRPRVLFIEKGRNPRALWLSKITTLPSKVGITLLPLVRFYCIAPEAPSWQLPSQPPSPLALPDWLALLRLRRFVGACPPKCHGQGTMTSGLVLLVSPLSLGYPNLLSLARTSAYGSAFFSGSTFIFLT